MEPKLPAGAAIFLVVGKAVLIASPAAMPYLLGATAIAAIAYVAKKD